MAGDATIGSAFIQLVPSAQGIGAAVTKELAGAGLAEKATQIGDEAGSNVSGGIVSKFSGIGGLLATALPVAGIVGGLGAIGSSFDDAFDKIQVTTGATGDKLAGLQGTFKEVFATVPTSADDASTAIGTLNQKLGITGTPLKDLSTQVLELSRITGTDLGSNIGAVTDTFNNWGVAVENQGNFLDDLFRVSQSTGVGVAELGNQMATNGVVLRQSGLDFDQAAVFLGTLAKNGLDAADVMPAFAKSLASAAKDGKSAKDVLSETFDAIKNAPSDTAGASAAMDVFGAKAGPKLAAAIREGKVSLDELNVNIAGTGAGIKDTADETADFPEKAKVAFNSLQVALQPVATAFLDLATTVATKLAPVLTDIIDYLTNHKAILIGIAGVIGTALVAAFVNWAIAAGTAAVATIAAAAPFIAIGAAIAAVVVGIIYAYNHFEAFRTVIDALGNAIKWVFNFVKDNWETILAILTGPIGVAVLVITKNWDTIKDGVGAMIDFVKNAFNGFVDFIKGLPGMILDALGDFAGLLVSKGKDLILGLVNGYVGAYTFIISEVVQLGSKILGWIGSFLGTLVGKGIELIQGFLQGIYNGEAAVANYVIGFGGRILSWIGNFSNYLIGAGEDLIRGLITGMGNMVGAAVQKVKDVASSIVNGAKNFLGIGSPSKVFHAIGINVGEGLVNGISSMSGAAADASSELAAAAVRAASTPLDFASAAPMALAGRTVPTVPYGASTGPSTTINLWQTNNTNATPNDIAKATTFSLATAGVPV